MASLDDDVLFESGQVELVSADGQIFRLPCTVAVMSQTVAAVLANDREQTSLHCPNVSSSSLRLVVDYMVHHNSDGRTPGDIVEIPKPIVYGDMRLLCKDVWDADFIMDRSIQDLFDLLVSANWLQLRPLIDLCSARLACLIKWKSRDEIGLTFGIESRNIN